MADVGTFFISHRELEVHTWSGGEEWFMVYCAATECIELTPGTWRCAFELMVEDRRGKLFTLSDSAAHFRVVCRMLSVYVVEPSESAVPDI
jgi:hypothetical protein